MTSALSVDLRERAVSGVRGRPGGRRSDRGGVLGVCTTQDLRRARRYGLGPRGGGAGAGRASAASRLSRTAALGASQHVHQPALAERQPKQIRQGRLQPFVGIAWKVFR